MDNQNNDMFSNMIQPNGIPEVEDSTNSSLPSNNSDSVSGGMNQNIGFNTFNQNSGVDGTLNQNNSGTDMNGGNSFIQPSIVSNDSNQNNVNNSNNLNSILPNEMVGQQVNANPGVNNDNANNLINQNMNNSVSSLDFTMPGESNNTSINNNLSVGGFEINNNVGQAENNSNVSSIGLNETGSSAVNNEVDNNLSNPLNNNILSEQNNTLNSNEANLGSTNLVNNNVFAVSSSSQEQNNAPSANNKENEVGEVVSVKKYFLHFFLVSLPIAGFIILIVRAFDKKDKNISNLAKAQLLYSLILGVISVVAVFLIMGIAMTSITTAIDNAKQSTNNNSVVDDDYTVDYDSNYYNLMD